jgi:hypothetical protein
LFNTETGELDRSLILQGLVTIYQNRLNEIGNEEKLLELTKELSISYNNHIKECDETKGPSLEKLGLEKQLIRLQICESIIRDTKKEIDVLYQRKATINAQIREIRSNPKQYSNEYEETDKKRKRTEYDGSDDETKAKKPKSRQETKGSSPRHPTYSRHVRKQERE